MRVVMVVARAASHRVEEREHATHRAASRRPVILLFIAVPETFRALRGWMEPTVPENYFQLRPGYTPGDLVPRSAETYLLCGVCVCVVVTSATSTCDMCRIDGVGRALFVCVVTSFVCRACLSWLGERELVPRLTRAVSRAGLRSPRPQARGPRGAQGDADQGVPRGVEDHDPVVCVCRVDGVAMCCLFVVVVCLSRLSRLDERELLFVCCGCVSCSRVAAR